MKMDSKSAGMNNNDDNDFIMSYNFSYPVFLNISPYSGNRIDC